MMTLDGSASSDPDSTPGTHDDIVLFEWFVHYGTELETLLGIGEVLDIAMPLGGHLVTLRVTDNAGATDTDTVQLAVVDTTPPEISVEVDPSSLWPPNHKLVDVFASVVAEDICSEPAVVLTSVTSSEPGHPRRGGDIRDAEVGTADFEMKLRASRRGNGPGRTYTLVYTATDSSGNESSATGTVEVPHN
jgi:hypothetical protein